MMEPTSRKERIRRDARECSVAIQQALAAAAARGGK